MVTRNSAQLGLLRAKYGMPSYLALQIPPGVQRGATSRSTPGRFFDANLVRWRNGSLTPIGGWEKIDTTTLPSTARVLHGWLAQNGARMIGIGCDGHLMVLWEYELKDVTPDGFTPDETSLLVGGYGVGLYGADDYGTGRLEGEPADFLVANTISMANFGDYLLAMTERDGRLLMYDPRLGPEQRFKEVVSPEGKAPVPRANRGMVVTPERTVVIFGANGNERLVAWGDKESLTGWDFNDIASQAGYQQLDASSGIIAGKVVKGGTLFFTQSEVFWMKFIGQPLIYGFDKIVANSSLVSPYSIAVADGAAIWMTRTGFKSFQGGVVKDIECDVLDYLLSDISPTWSRLYTHAVVDNVYQEITWYYPSKSASMYAKDDYFTINPDTLEVTHDPDNPDDTENGTGAALPGQPDSYVTYSYAEGWWTKGRLDRTAGLPVLVGHDPVMADSKGNLYRHELDTVSAFASPGAGPIFAKTSAFELGKDGAMTTLNGVLPDSESGYGSTEWRFSTRFTPETTETTWGPYHCRPDGYMDVRLTARQVEIEVRQYQDGRWTVGKPLFDVKPRGKR